MTASMESTLYWTCTPAFDVTKQSIIFLHASWMSSEMFDETVAYLSKSLPDVNLISPDLMAHGKTTKSPKEFTLWDQGDEVVKLMDALQIPHATLVGISMGAAITLRAALSHPARISRLILLSSTATAATAASLTSMEQMRDIWVSTPQPSEEIMNLAVQSWWDGDGQENGGGDGSPDVNGERACRVKAHWTRRHSGRENVDSILCSLNARDDVVGRLGEIGVPTLLVHGERDGTWGVEGAERIRDAINGAGAGAGGATGAGAGGEASSRTEVGRARLVVIKGSGHLVIHMRDCEDVARLIEGFVREEGS